MKNKILKQITEFCKLCNSHNNCPEDDCVLFRIEKITLKEEIKMKEHNKEELTNKIVELFKNYMIERGYKIWKSESPDSGISYTARKEEDKYIPFFELCYGSLSKYKIAEYEVSVTDRAGDEGLHGRTVASYYLHLNQENSEEAILNEFKKILDNSYKSYNMYSRNNRLDSVYNNLKHKYIHYLDRRNNYMVREYEIEGI